MQLRRDKKRDAVGRPSWRSSFLRDPGAEFFGGKLNKQKNSLNFASTCLKVVDNCRDFIHLAAGADKILTDSGGVRREAYLLRKPCIVLLELSWFPEILNTGWKVLTGPDSNRISDLIENFEPTAPYQELFGDGNAHRKIVDTLMQRYDC